MSSKIYEIQVTTADGKTTTLKDYQGKALLIVNVASQCGFTPQYEGLEKLYRDHHKEGLEILAFPCNQFGAQEPGDENEIMNFCKMKYDVTFPLFKKIDVNGPHAHPLFSFLKTEKKGVLWTEAIKWNFTKFLVDRHGNVVGRYAPKMKPEQLKGVIAKVLAVENHLS